tara:strand:- start:262 stop:936 length:675 start_codon:yes stop_codon:yes gene_type:complete
MENNYRFEKKFLIPYCYQNNIYEIISSNPFRFSECFQERTINNIYFDDLNLNSARDNIDGNPIRSKLRLRWYGEKYGKIKSVIEKKIKKGNIGRKYFYEINDLLLSRESNKFSIQSEIEKKCKNLFIVNTLKCCKPTLLNSYKRRYFISIDKKVRITVDFDLENYKINDISHFNIPFSNNKYKMIMELKYNNNFSTDISSICQYFPFRTQKYSKYINGFKEVNL